MQNIALYLLNSSVRLVPAEAKCGVINLQFN